MPRQTRPGPGPEQPPSSQRPGPGRPPLDPGAGPAGTRKLTLRLAACHLRLLTEVAAECGADRAAVMRALVASLGVPSVRRRVMAGAASR